LSSRPPARFAVAFPPETRLCNPGLLVEAVRSFLEGESSGLLDLLGPLLPRTESLAPFWRNLQELDLQTAVEFFQRGPKRNRDLKARHGIGERLLRPAELDDLLALSSPRTRTSVGSGEGDSSAIPGGIG
jgi:hypothetical protein